MVLICDDIGHLLDHKLHCMFQRRRYASIVEQLQRTPKNVAINQFISTEISTHKTFAKNCTPLKVWNEKAANEKRCFLFHFLQIWNKIRNQKHIHTRCTPNASLQFSKMGNINNNNDKVAHTKRTKSKRYQKSVEKFRGNCLTNTSLNPNTQMGNILAKYFHLWKSNVQHMIASVCYECTKKWKLFCNCLLVCFSFICSKRSWASDYSNRAHEICSIQTCVREIRMYI